MLDYDVILLNILFLQVYLINGKFYEVQNFNEFTF